jgi:Spx/MgsR family transcriptional regulator
MTTIYGIANCDTVKKARVWFAEAGIAAEFHDYKKLGVPTASLGQWVDRAGWEKLLNRSGATFRKLRDEVKAGLDRDRAVALMLAHPSAIRRPVVVDGDVLEVGFDPVRYTALFGR